MTSSYTDTALH